MADPAWKADYERLRKVARGGSQASIIPKAGVEWVEELGTAKTKAIAAILSDLHANRPLEALRDAARIVVDDRLSRRMLCEMRILEVVGIAVGVAAIISRINPFGW